jgi:mono/diheme cytochrome c family protein
LPPIDIVAKGFDAGIRPRDRVPVTLNRNDLLIGREFRGRRDELAVGSTRRSTAPRSIALLWRSEDVRSANDFWRALHDGVRRDGQQLYPAMPYTSYRGMTRADADAIYAYAMQLRPMKVANRRTELNFPFNIRLGMLGWNLLFLHDNLPSVSAGSSPAWQRGRYLVNVLGHCGECHTPRGIVGEMELSRSLTGFALGRVAAPDITPAGLAARGWTAAGLRVYLGRGIAPQGSAFSDMHPVVMLSTTNLTAEDLSAVAIYLLGDNQQCRGVAMTCGQIR